MATRLHSQCTMARGGEEETSVGREEGSPICRICYSFVLPRSPNAFSRFLFSGAREGASRPVRYTDALSLSAPRPRSAPPISENSVGRHGAWPRRGPPYSGGAIGARPPARCPLRSCTHSPHKSAQEREIRGPLLLATDCAVVIRVPLSDALGPSRLRVRNDRQRTSARTTFLPFLFFYFLVILLVRFLSSRLFQCSCVHRVAARRSNLSEKELYRNRETR